jgi:hypothetical protein
MCPSLNRGAKGVRDLIQSAKHNHLFISRVDISDLHALRDNPAVASRQIRVRAMPCAECTCRVLTTVTPVSPTPAEWALHAKWSLL